MAQSLLFLRNAIITALKKKNKLPQKEANIQFYKRFEQIEIVCYVSTHSALYNIQFDVFPYLCELFENNFIFVVELRKKKIK